MRWKCFLDLDGVVVDFFRGACDLHSLHHREFERGVWDWVHCSGLDSAEFWSPMGEEFWANLGHTHDGPHLLELIERRFGTDRVCILTSPARTSGCCDGKIAWVRKHLPAYTDRILIGKAKDFCAGPNAVLVDDSDHNVEAFVAEGGHGVLVPRWWNALHGMLEDDQQAFAVDYVDRRLKEIGVWQ